MSKPEHDRRVDYVEFPAAQLDDVKPFYTGAFGWQFTDYGPTYTSFDDGRLQGGFTTNPDTTAPLVVLYAANLEEVCAQVTEHGGEVVKEIFSFPGGRRFHFKDPAGNHLAVWSDGAAPSDA